MEKKLRVIEIGKGKHVYKGKGGNNIIRVGTWNLRGSVNIIMLIKETKQMESKVIDIAG